MIISKAVLKKEKIGNLILIETTITEKKFTIAHDEKGIIADSGLYVPMKVLFDALSKGEHDDN